jgi:hypothetical protein
MRSSKERPWRSRWLVASLFAALSAAGCGYGEVTPRCYDYAKALYSICNRRDADRLEEFDALIEADLLAGELAEREAGWLRQIADQARSGEWASAQSAARKLLDDQVEAR